MVRRALACLAVCLFGYSASADDSDLIDDILDYFQDKAFTVHLVVRLLDDEEVIVWDVEHTDVTVAGRALNVRLVGDDIIIDAFLTPFGSVDSNLMIVAYGQLWFKDRLDEGVKYESFMKSLPVEPGERVIFFPLGVAVDSNTNIYTIQLEIQLLPYRNSGPEESAD
jgi:hypothetical protein